MDWGIKEINDRLVVLPMANAQSLLNTKSISEYHVLLKSDAAMDAVRDRLAQHFKEAGLDVTVFRWIDRATFFHQVEAVLGGFLDFIATVAAIVCFTSLLNASYMNFAQRAREFATLRSLGFTRAFIMILTALENIWLAVAAALIGVGATVAVTWTIRAAKITWTPPGSSNASVIDVAWVVSIYVVAAFGVAILAVIASIPPTRKIVRQPIRSVLSAS
jgi:putative ABC transport system permease protein